MEIHYMERDEYNKILEKLTPRQVKIFALVGEGKTSGEIADELYICEKTVQNHRNTIARNLDLQGYGSLYHLAVQFDLQNEGGGVA